MAGSPPADAADHRTRRSDAFDWVILDTPPVALLPDANLLAAMVDAAVLVVSAPARRRTPWSSAPSRPSAATGSSASCSIASTDRSALDDYYDYYEYNAPRRRLTRRRSRCRRLKPEHADPMHRDRARFVLVVCRDGADRGAVAVAAYVRLGDWMWDVHDATSTAFCEGAARRGRLPDLPVLRRSVRLRRSSDRARTVRAHCPGARRASFILAAIYYWFPCSMIGRGVFLIAARSGHRR